MFCLRRLTVQAQKHLKPIHLNKCERVACIYVDTRRDCSTRPNRRTLLAVQAALVQSHGRFESTAAASPETVIPPVVESTQATKVVEETVASVGAETVENAPVDPLVQLAPEEVIPPIPEPPVAPVEEVVELLGGEPSFASQGLGGWSPVGMIQNCFEYLHIGCEIPWWTTIVIGTVCVRVLIFPLVIIAQRNAAKMHNNMPQMQVLQSKMSDARERGDRLDSARYAQEMMVYMKEKEINPFKNMLVPFAQAPIFISFFMGLREMCNLPVESLKTGGMLWFTDLTVPDQFYLLPILTSATLYLTIELGTDAARLNSANLGVMKYVFRAIPVIVLPFTMNFAGGVLVYWMSSNFISLCQVAFLRIPAVRDYFKIERMQTFDPKELPVKNKGFVKGINESWTNMKITRELEERQRLDEINFMRAGRGAVKKTFKTDPTRLPKSIPTIQAKPRD